MSETFILVGVIIILAWGYDFINGVNDCANAIATTVSTRALKPYQAVLMAAVFNALGAFLTTAVAKTIGKGIVDPADISLWILVFALVGAIVWSGGCSYLGIPISITHAMVGGLMGAAAAAFGVGAWEWSGIRKVVIAMVLSPIAGFVIGYAFMVTLLWLSRRAVPRKAHRFFRVSQIFSAAAMAFTHGANDTQNAMGVITAALVIAGFQTEFHVPAWVILGSAVFMGLGTQIGGWRIIRTMGSRMVRLQPSHGFSAETSSALVILVNSWLGAPISTTQVIATAIMGVGATENVNAVRWALARRIVITWFLTIPGAAAISAVCFYLGHYVFGVA
jgi:PiT family inorganic phosphate transporter